MLPVFAAAPILSACLIPEAPQYGAPEKTPVFIIDSTVDPNPRELLKLVLPEDRGTQSFGFKVRSEDANEEVVAVLYLNYKHEGGLLLMQVNYDPLTFNEERTISLGWKVPDERVDTPGCHAVTLMVLHESGWDDLKKEVIGTPSDLASVTWFVSLEELGKPLAVLSSCPDSGTSDPDPVP
jgi:hypothetical protein